MRILAIDTSTVTATVAIIEDGRLLGEFTQNNKWTHSVKLLPLIDQVLQGCDLDISEIDAFACAKGPGSFTGLRIGAATVKGLAQAAGKPIAGVFTLDALAFNLYNAKGLICPILDAQRNMVYAALYEWQNNGLEKLEDYRAILIDELIERLNAKGEHINFLGDAALIYIDVLMEKADNFSIAPHNLIMPRASSVGILAHGMIKDNHVDTYHSFKPYYIRKSQAEVEYEKKQSIDIFKMEANDIDDICEVEKLSFKTPWSKSSFIGELSNEMAKYYVAKIEDKVIGYGGMWLVMDEAHITNIAVHPDYRTRKIGEKLLEALIEESKKNNIEKMTLEVRPSNEAARGLYKKHGFSDFGIRKGYYPDTGEDGIIMWKHLIL